MPDRPADQIEQIFSRTGFKDNLHMWEKLYVSRTGRTNPEGDAMNVLSEDSNVEPDRAGFIREMSTKWEGEWLAEDGKNL